MCEQKISSEKFQLPEKGGIFGCIPARYVVAAMCFTGILFQYMIKVLLSVAIVAMVKSESETSSGTQNLSTVTTMATQTEDLDVCPGQAVSSSSDYEGEFDWSEDIQGYALSAYYYGYVATQLLGGRLSEVIGSKFVLGPGVFVAGLVTLLSPLAAKLHISAFIAARVLAGAASGVVIPSTNYMLTNWIIPEEMSLILGFMLSGSPVGTCLSMILSGVLADAGGWPLVFYFFGCLGVLFIIPWMFLAYDSPNSHPRISETEKEFILNNTANKDKDNTKAALSVPWLAILTSGPMWIHILMCCGYSWVGYTMLSELPSYLSKMLHFDLQSSSLISSLPYIFLGLSSFGSSYVSYWLRMRGFFSRLTGYRIFNGLCGYGACAALIAITFVGCDSTVIVVLLVCTLFMVGMFHGGSFFNHVDLGSNYTGTLAGIFFTLSNSMGILAPTITGLIINEQQTLSRWKLVFYVGAGLPCITTTLYMFFGTVKEQPWNKLPESSEKTSEFTKAQETV